MFGRRRHQLLVRRADGRFDLAMAEEERELLTSLLDQLAEAIEADPDAPQLRRLFPSAYPDDPEREAEYQLLAGEELRASRRASIATVRATAQADVLAEDEVVAWMQAVNALRLVLGTVLDVSEEDDPELLDPDDPALPTWALYQYLSVLLERIVTALSS